MRALIGFLLVLATVAAAAGAVYWLSEARRWRAYAEVVRERESASIERERGLRERNGVLRERVEGLEAQLFSAQNEQERTRHFLEEKVGELVAQREARAAEAKRRARRAMPDSVRLVLARLNQCLAEDGHESLRFLHARSLRDDQLLTVEAIDHDQRTLSTSIYTADAVELALDRAAGALTVRWLGGRVVSGDRTEEIPDDGRALVLADVNGPMWERRLGHMLAAKGRYPEPGDASEKRPRNLDVYMAQVWLSRLDRLVRGATTTIGYRVDKLRDLRDGVFEEVVIHGYAGKLLERSIEADRLEVQVDDAAEVVELVIRGGWLRGRAGPQQISEQPGHRLFLPGVTPETARDTMLGMVTERR